jgi:hypothetical protein
MGIQNLGIEPLLFGGRRGGGCLCFVSEDEQEFCRETGDVQARVADQR